MNFYIQKIYVDKQGTIWIAAEAGLFSIDQETGEYTSYEPQPSNPHSISDNSISDILEDKKGNLWIATFNGLNRIKSNQSGDLVFERFYHEENLSEKSIIANQVTALKEINNKLYIGTIAGLCSYNLEKEQFENYSQINHKYWIQSIEKTEDDNLWASTTEGIFYFDTSQKSFNIFEKSDGLSDLTFRHGSSDTDQEGYIYFGSRAGITRLKPNSIITNEIAPPVYITDIKAMSPKRETFFNGIYKKELILNHDDYYLSVNFAALNYNRGEKNQYASKLEGLDESWNTTQFGIPIVYTNLKPKTYTFKVKASNNDGVWNEEGVSIKMIKKPAYWETWWFKLITLAIISLLVGLSVSIYTKRIRIKNNALKKYNYDLNKEILERKRFEKALKNRERFLRLIMDNVPQFIYWVDKNFRYLGGNRTLLKFLKIESEAELKGKKLENFFIPPDYITKQQELLKTVVNSKMPIYNQIEKTPEHPKYASLWLEQSYIPLKNDEGKIIGMLVSGRDITERVKVEDMEKEHAEKLKEYNKELKRSNRDLEQFAYIASHDLKEPLRMIGNFSGLLAKSYKNQLGKDAFEYIDFIEDGVLRMSRLINSLLTYSRVGRKEIIYQEIDLNQLVAVKIFDLSQIIKDRNAKVEVASLPIIYGEREQIGMIFYNLINNAIKFNKKEQPIVIINSHKDSPKGFWQFSVKDNGIGIAPKYQQQIFEIFRRLHGQKEYEGTGIGLSVCQKIVFRHKGKIWLESEPDIGTTFFFTISKELNDKVLDEGKRNTNVIVPS